MKLTGWLGYRSLSVVSPLRGGNEEMFPLALGN